MFHFLLKVQRKFLKALQQLSLISALIKFKIKQITQSPSIQSFVSKTYHYNFMCSIKNYLLIKACYYAL